MVAAKAPCNESTYLRVVGFRESMHDDDDYDDYLEPRTLFMIYCFPSEQSFTFPDSTKCRQNKRFIKTPTFQLNFRVLKKNYFQYIVSFSTLKL